MENCKKARVEFQEARSRLIGAMNETFEDIESSIARLEGGCTMEEVEDVEKRLSAYRKDLSMCGPDACSMRDASHLFYRAQTLKSKAKEFEKQKRLEARRLTDPGFAEFEKAVKSWKYMYVSELADELGDHFDDADVDNIMKEKVLHILDREGYDDDSSPSDVVWTYERMRATVDKMMQKRAEVLTRERPVAEM